MRLVRLKAWKGILRFVALFLQFLSLGALFSGTGFAGFCVQVYEYEVPMWRFCTLEG